MNTIILHETSDLTCRLRDPPFINLICLIITILYVMEMEQKPTTFFGKARRVCLALGFYIAIAFLYFIYWKIAITMFPTLFYLSCPGSR